MYEESNINKIIEDLAKNKVVEKIVYKINRNEEQANLQDLIQDIYFQLLTKNTDKIIELYNNGQLNFYITRIITNNICSVTSPYHRIYRQKTGDNFDTLSFTKINSFVDNNVWTTL